MQTENQRSIRVLLVDRHAVFRAGVHKFLDRQPHVHVVGEASSPQEAHDAARASRPDIILLALDFGESDALPLLPRLIETAPGVKVIVLTGVRDPQAHRRALRLGARGLVLKEQSIEIVLQAIETVHSGKVWLEGAVRSRVLGEQARERQTDSYDADKERRAELTDREREVIRLVGEGLRNGEIAERLVIREATVRHHLTSIFAKLNVADRFELLIYAYRHGLATLPSLDTL